jgi:hypothetical protein
MRQNRLPLFPEWRRSFLEPFPTKLVTSEGSGNGSGVSRELSLYLTTYLCFIFLN